MLSLVLPKGSLEKATLELFDAADIPVQRSSDVAYKGTINDPRIDQVRILRPQEIPRYVADGLFDLGITGRDWVAETGSNRWYDDSKATTPEAVLAASGAFESLVLIAGGRNKGLDLAGLAGASSVRAVVAIGEAAGEVGAVFAGARPVKQATDMAGAVAVAGEMALPGEAIVLSPGCTSFDWYESYRQRGEHFAALVRAAVGEGGPE